MWKCIILERNLKYDVCVTLLALIYHKGVIWYLFPNLGLQIKRGACLVLKQPVPKWSNSGASPEQAPDPISILDSSFSLKIVPASHPRTTSTVQVQRARH
jgi:hypothetical protein